MELGGARKFSLSVVISLGLCSSLQAFELVVRKPTANDSRDSSRALSASSFEIPSSLTKSKVSSSESLELLKFETEEELQEAKRRLEDEGFAVEENAIFRANLITEDIELAISNLDEFLGSQWSLVNRGSISSNTFGGADIDALRAWSVSEGGGRLYIVDSGVDRRASDLADRVLNVYSAIDGLGPEDENSHGTHVASIAAAAKNTEGIMGVAPENVEIVSVRMLDAENSGNTFTAVRAFEIIRDDLAPYLAEDPRRFAVISNSWGGPQFSAALQSAMQAVVGPRVLVITSAGNETQDNDRFPYYPCNFNLANNICVAATDRDDTLASFSSYGAQTVHIMAPGRQILGTIPGILQGSSYRNMWAEKSGTSQATPHVAGAALLVWSANPDLDASQVKSLLLRGVDRLPGAEDKVLAGGRLNAYRSVLMATGQDPALADRGYAVTSTKKSSCGVGGRPMPVSIIGILLAVFFLSLVYRRSEAKELNQISQNKFKRKN